MSRKGGSVVRRAAARPTDVTRPSTSYDPVDAVVTLFQVRIGHRVEIGRVSSSDCHARCNSRATGLHPSRLYDVHIIAPRACGGFPQSIQSQNISNFNVV